MPLARVRALPLALALVGRAWRWPERPRRSSCGRRRDVTTSSEQAWTRLPRGGARTTSRCTSARRSPGTRRRSGTTPTSSWRRCGSPSKMRGRDPERAKSLLASRGALPGRRSREREKLMLRIYEERWGKRDMTVLGSALRRVRRRRFPDDPGGLPACGANLLAMARSACAEAIAEYERLLTVNPNYAIAYNTLGYYWARRAATTRRPRTTSSATATSRRTRRTRYDSLGELYALTGRYDEAEENLKKALAIKEDFYPPLRPPRHRRGRAREPREGRRVLPQGRRQRPEHRRPRTTSASSSRSCSWTRATSTKRVQGARRRVAPRSPRSRPGPRRKLKAPRRVPPRGAPRADGRHGGGRGRRSRPSDVKELTDPKEPKTRRMARSGARLIRGVIAMGAGRDAEAVHSPRRAASRTSATRASADRTTTRTTSFARLCARDSPRPPRPDGGGGEGAPADPEEEPALLPGAAVPRAGPRHGAAGADRVGRARGERLLTP